MDVLDRADGRKSRGGNPVANATLGDRFLGFVLVEKASSSAASLARRRARRFAIRVL